MARRSRVLVAFAAVTFVAVGCAPLAVDGQSLLGTSWSAVSVAGQRPIGGSKPTIVFELDGRIHGSAGCNSYTSQGPIGVDGGKLEIGSTLMTLGACVGDDGVDLPVMAVEEAFSSALGAADHIAMRGLELVISGPSGEIVFRRL